jgi:N-acetylglucosaminyldiphosphoundecaprenol N-acetyl-beta-D-mannosaminyltransferase
MDIRQLLNQTYRQLGVRVNALQIPEVIAIAEHWIQCRGPSQYIAVTGMHGMAEASEDPQFRHVLNEAGLVVPDGMPLVWLARYHGYHLERRVYGPELMMTFCQMTVHKGYRHFFYGGAEGVAQGLACTLKQRFPALAIAGTYTPPFRPLTAEEEAEVENLVSQAKPDILWVGLSTPKQEKWMFAHRHLSVPVMVGVGAAFDLNTGRVRQAPRWMREHGLEWLFRLSVEPRRLWRRYLIQGSKFLFYVLAEVSGLRKFG